MERLPLRILIPGAEMWTGNTGKRLEEGFERALNPLSAFTPARDSASTTPSAGSRGGRRGRISRAGTTESS